MVPARNLPLLRDAHGATPPFVVGVTTTAPIHMAQEPLDRHHRKPSKQTTPPPQARQADQESHRLRHGEEADEQLVARPLLATAAGVVSQEAAGTSGSSSGGSSGNGGDWLRLGLAPASSPAAASAAGGSQHRHPLDLFADRAVQPQPVAFLRPAAPGIPQASVTLPAPRAGPPWMPPWSPAAAPPPMMLPFAHRTFYTPGGGAYGADTIRVGLPPAAVAMAAGVWFALQAAPHQGREPFLPQIPRSYLRIKDVRVTVRLLIKYLVSKLGLEDESEVEITCRGRPLLPFLTLQHVRDSIWCHGDAISPSVALDMSNAANHLMILQYGRRP
ncbi:hypothetical protein QOZ80_4BG0350990 [Eleusine coracana subsp. coracana]|nr:hypothetical protein QOZ80_4BG0350990 [Eleusine coracana subsp. coracana]